MNKMVLFKKGAVLVDKPAGITSFELVEQVKDILDIEKAGHSGTLDMTVTGVMLIAVNEATKAMPVLMGLEKEYEGVMHIHGDIEEPDLRKVCNSFVGKIVQTPPRRSAVKREPRQREIYSLDILNTNGRDVYFRVRCQSGTYIRKLCSDIGEKLGCGAHMTKLRRTRLGPFSISECIKLEHLSEKNVKPLEEILERIGLKKIIIKEEFLEKVVNGVPLDEKWVERIDKNIEKGEIIGIYLRGEIIALGKYKEKKLAKIDRVFKV